MLPRVITFLTENWGLKLAALGLAILLWLAVTANDLQTASFRNIPVAVDLRDPDWRLVRTEPEAVTVTVRGPRGELVELGTDPPRFVLPVERVTDTIEAQVVPMHWIQLPVDVRDTRVVGLRPDTIRFHYERLATRRLPVRVRTTGELPRGYVLALPISTSPSTVEVRGPLTLLETMDSVPLEPVDLSGITSTTNVPAPVDSAELARFNFDPGEVNVVLRVMPADSQPILDPDSVQVRAPF